MLTLYRLASCPFCAKVEHRLDALDLEYETVDVPRARSQRTTVHEISDQTGVPVLADPENGVEGMAESDDIVAYLNAQYT